MEAVRTDLVNVSDVFVDQVTDLGVHAHIHGEPVFIPLFLIGVPRPSMEPGEVVRLSIAGWFARQHHLTESR